MVPAALVLNKSLLKKLAVAVLVAVAETVLSAPAKGKKSR